MRNGTRLLAIAASLVLTVGAATVARPRPAQELAGSTGFRLRQDAGRLPDAKAVRAAAWRGGDTQAATGESVHLEISDAYSDEAVPVQWWADFIAGLVHADELARLVVRIAPPDEIRQLCGEDALGCYGGNELLIPGEASAGVPAEEIARHEYGHHVAANRLNSPWRAVDWGPKRWATTEGVCARVRSGTAFPGDEGRGYTQNPGEAFAEAYRVLNDRRAGLSLSWSLVDDSFLPDDADLAAVEQDVTAPWLRPTVRVVRTRLRSGGPREWRTTVATPLDGLVSVVFRLPAHSLHRLRVLAPDGRELGRGSWAGTRVQKLSFPVCGTRTATLVVTRDGPPGPVSLTVTVP